MPGWSPAFLLPHHLPFAQHSSMEIPLQLAEKFHLQLHHANEPGESRQAKERQVWGRTRSPWSCFHQFQAGFRNGAFCRCMEMPQQTTGRKWGTAGTSWAWTPSASIWKASGPAAGACILEKQQDLVLPSALRVSPNAGFIENGLTRPPPSFVLIQHSWAAGRSTTETWCAGKEMKENQKKEHAFIKKRSSVSKHTTHECFFVARCGILDSSWAFYPQPFSSEEHNSHMAT